MIQNALKKDVHMLLVLLSLGPQMHSRSNHWYGENQEANKRFSAWGALLVTKVRGQGDCRNCRTNACWRRVRE